MVSVPFLLVAVLLVQASIDPDFKTKARELASVAEQHPADAKAWYALGRIRSELARACYKQLFSKIPPDSPYADAVKAENLMHRQDYRRAFSLFREALQKDPNLISARSALIEIYRSDGHSDWAQQEQAAISTVDCSAHRLACGALASRYDSVLAATEVDTSPEALYWRAQAYTGLEYQAFARLERLPDSPELHRFKAGLFYEAGQRAQVVKELQKALAISTRDAELERDLAMALAAAGDYPAAYKLAREMLLRQPASPELNALAGDALLNLQRAGEAIPYLKKALASDPNNPVTHASLARAYTATGSLKSALPHLDAAQAADRDGSLHYQLARAYQQAGKTELAAKAMKEYEQLSKKVTDAPEPEITAP
jgi:tetratricopeptide (TPR) repeat protein